MISTWRNVERSSFNWLFPTTHCALPWAQISGRQTPDLTPWFTPLFNSFPTEDAPTHTLRKKCNTKPYLKFYLFLLQAENISLKSFSRIRKLSKKLLNQLQILYVYKKCTPVERITSDTSLARLSLDYSQDVVFHKTHSSATACRW
jgi:hypothetical protein